MTRNVTKIIKNSRNNKINAYNFGLKRRVDLSKLQRIPVNFVMKKCMQTYSRFASMRLDTAEPLARRLGHELYSKTQQCHCHSNS